MFQLHYYIAFAGVWAIGNGILHDIFVLIQKRPFEKELIRLLIDGHIMIFTGIFYLICYNGIKTGQPWAYYIAIATAAFMIGYCLLIFKMLPTVGMTIINIIALVWVLIQLQKIN